MALPHGFKAEAERTAIEVRSKVGIDAYARLDIEAAAASLGVRVRSADSLVDRSRLEEIERLQAFSFSACTFDINGKPVIVYNPLRTVERRASDIAHELAHIVLDHQLSEVQYLDGVAFRTCQPDQEEQATALGGTLLLPRPLLLAAAREEEAIEDLAARFGVTVEMARFRWNTTGVKRQITAERNRRGVRR